MSESTPFSDKRYSFGTADSSQQEFSSASSRGGLSRRRENDAVTGSSELPPPFSHPHRRKREEKIVHYAMKAVLLSPVAVLALWTIGTVLFTSKRVQTMPASRRTISQRHARKNVVPTKSKREAVAQEILDVVEVAEHAFGNKAPPAGNVIPVALPQQPMPQNSSPQFYQQYPQQVQYVAPQQSNIIVQPGTLLNAQPPSSNTVNQQLVRQEPIKGEQQPQMRMASPGETRLRKGKKVYYYDPRRTVSAQGQFYLPPIVYDEKGYPHELSRLEANEIWVEPPQMAQQPPGKAQLRESPSKGASFSEAVEEGVEWTESSATNQSIIVCTVGVMALLIGAVSARKMRSRSILSVCIENETLEDEVAFDSAYTVASDTYNTFAHWKNDLEKFDV